MSAFEGKADISDEPNNFPGLSGKAEPMPKKTAAFRQRRAADTARWRERLKKGTAIYPVEVDGRLFDLMERFGELRDGKIDRKTVSSALSRLLGRAVDALLREEIVTRHDAVARTSFTAAGDRRKPKSRNTATWLKFRL